MFCDTVVDRQWKKTAERRAREEESYQRQEAKAKMELKRMEKVELTDEMVGLEMFELMCNNDDDVDFNAAEEGEEEEGEVENNRPKRRRLLQTGAASPTEEINAETIPERFRHLRNSIKSVKTDYYETIVKLKTQFHCSNSQAVAGVVLTGQLMFKLPWKFFDTDKTCIDLDTAPSAPNNRRETRVRELLALTSIVEKMMTSDQTSTITYHDDGSRKQGTGAFSVQGITIDRKYHALPTLALARETRSNLKDLEV